VFEGVEGFEEAAEDRACFVVGDVVGDRESRDGAEIVGIECRAEGTERR
jgi:hypothetical protein